MTEPMIRIEGLTKHYGATQALNQVSFDVPRGQVVGFLGPNGAGKSTTMRILAGYVLPTSGTAKVAGIDVLQSPEKARARMGYLPENNPLYEDMMVKEFLTFIAEVRRIPKSDQQAKIKHAVQRCGLESVLGKDISQLSKGYRQRVGLAQAIVHDPDLLILDEPTSGLDPNQIVEIRNLIKELGQEKTVILSTHILSEVQGTCSRVLIINNGRLVADDSPEKLTTGSGDGSVAVVISSRLGTSVDGNAIRQTLLGIPGVKGVEPATGEGPGTVGFLIKHGPEDIRRALFEVALRSELVLLEIRRQQISLEETFRKLTSDNPRAAA